MKSILIIVTFLFAFITIRGQIDVDVELLQISNVGEVTDDFFTISDSFLGPHFTFEIKISNHSDSVISVNLDNIVIKLKYKYQDSAYLIIIDNISSKCKGSISLDTNEQIFIYFGCDIFYNTDIFKGSDFPYYKEIIEMLPTMQLVFYDGNNEKNIKNINNVILIKNETESKIPPYKPK